jgi:hypothetical protein
MIIHNVNDRRHGYIGSFEAEPLTIMHWGQNIFG